MDISWGFVFLAFMALAEFLILIFIKVDLKAMGTIIQQNANANNKLCKVLDKQGDTFDRLERKVSEDNAIIKERLKK